MHKLKMRSVDGVARNIEKIGELFPSAVTEVVRGGKAERAIDFDVLRQELSDAVVEGREERYQFTWPDKKKAVLAANAPVSAALRPVVAESVGRDGTAGGFDSKNLYIEGDNLEVLKLLRETYLGRVKMIYIDPPYNTGGDFIYNDDFAQEAGEYMKNSGQFDEEGNRMEKNLESNGRFHTDWLNMIYPRLKVAKDLLAEDGVIFISIDDGEACNLRKVCDEIFSANNFVADLSVVNNLKGRNDKKYIARANDRIVMYVKSQNYSEHGLPLTEDILGDYKEEDKKGKFRLLELRKRGGQDTRKDRPNMYYPFYVNPHTGDVSLEQSSTFSCVALPIKSNGIDGRWRWGQETARKNIQDITARKVGTKYNIYEKDYLESDEGARRVRPKSVLSGASYSTDVATKEYRMLMGDIDFSNPKPVSLLKDLIIYATNPTENAIVLDFFSGSATTAHGILCANSLENGNRKFIMIQLPEICKEDSEEFKAGYKNICEIGKERIRRAGKKIREENPLTTQDLDIGFRCLRLDTSNMKDVYYRPDELQQGDLFDSVDNVKEDRTPEDLLFQAMLELGAPLSAKIERKELGGREVFCVEDDYLLACFDGDVTDETAAAMAKMKPQYAVLRDNSMKSDSVAVNFEQIFRTYSPDTKLRVL